MIRGVTLRWPIRTAFIVAAVQLVVSGHALTADSSLTSHKVNSTRSATALIYRYCSAYHSIGRLGLFVDNQAGIQGDPNWLNENGFCFIGNPNGLNAEYPFGSHCQYLWRAGIWVGGIIDGDTLVSTEGTDRLLEWGGNWEFFDELIPYGSIEYRTAHDRERYPLAISEEEYISAVTDTLDSDTPGYSDQVDPLDTWRRHKPLGVRVSTRSYAWGSPQTDDIVLFDWTVSNIGDRTIKEMYVGMHVDPDVLFQVGYNVYGSWDDDICGFLQTYPAVGDCATEDTVNVAWSADNDGEPDNGRFVESPVRNSQRHVLGLHLLGHPDRKNLISYNWWVTNEDPRFDWGPRRLMYSGYGIRDFQTGGLGTPWGDRNSYYQLSNGEIDYDLVRMRQIAAEDQRWLPPSPLALNTYAAGADVRYLLSVGPFELGPGEEVSFPFAMVGGENFHTDPANGDRLRAGDVNGYMARLDFSSLVKNANMADRIYDNPGVDTDGDGYAGKFATCVMDSQWIDSQWVYSAAETTWTEGDGIADWRAALPPPPPHVWLVPMWNGIRVRFNGYNSETTKDYFTRQIDFEGYRIYFGRDDREASLALAAQYDRLNFDRYTYRQITTESGEWECRETPFTLEQLQCRYGRGADPCNDSTFDPLSYARADPLLSKLGDTAIYFVPHEANIWQLGAPNIYKLYPDATKPTLADTNNPAAKTEDGYYKYYEYAYDIQNLLPTVRYYLNVTAFDFGSASVDQPPLETGKTEGTQFTYPLADENQTGDKLPPVYIYPNPYFGDGRYRENGFEARGDPHINDRVREIHFVNVPLHCWVKIFTLDGDMVRAIRHDADASDPNGHHEIWDMINRNIQSVMSGLYYWTVEEDGGPVQIGKLVIIR
jgi:hypothetical protein